MPLDRTVNAPAPLICPKCQASLAPEETAGSFSGPCPSCNRPVEQFVFPAYWRPVAIGRNAEALVTTEDASCFNHPARRAQAPCDICGRFLCGLCDVEIQGQHFCPTCVNASDGKRRVRNLDGGRTLWSGIALLLSIVPILVFWPLTILTGPVAVFLAIYGWRKPQSLVRPGRAAAIVAIVFGLGETVLWALAIAGLARVF